MTKRLVLFDIDGTLVLTGRAGLRALDRALGDVCGSSDLLDGVPTAGRTDRAILSDVLQRLRRDVDDAVLDAVRDAYCGYLAEEVHRESPHPKRVLPGVPGALTSLEADEAQGRAAVGLLTGNFARGAEIKLGYFDLWTRFRFGAFGDAHVDRRDLVPVALDAAAAAGVGTFAPRHTIVIGDTPADVDCAHHHGALAIAVATGPYTVDDLRATAAEIVVPDLSDWPAIWSAIGA